MSTDDLKPISYSVKDAARVVGCSMDIIRAAITNGHLTPHYISKGLRVIEAAELAEWVKNAPTEAPS